MSSSISVDIQKSRARTPNMVSILLHFSAFIRTCFLAVFHCVQSQKNDRLRLVMKGISIKMMFALLVKVHDENTITG